MSVIPGIYSGRNRTFVYGSFEKYTMLPYRDLVHAAQQAHQRVYALKSGKTAPYAGKPRYQ